ncbi:MAG TPA: hypothetical protein VIV40_22240 [Kofleriaceae bacterium]
MRRLLAVGLLAGCYAPSPPAGSPCLDGVCPTGLVCSPATNTCEHGSADRDAAPDDALTDANPPSDGSTALFMYRRRITIVNASPTSLAAGFTIRLPLNNTLATLVNQGKAKADFSDVRVIGDGSLGERDRIIDTAPAPSALSFSLAQPVNAGATNTSYYVYYGAPSAGAAPANGNAVFPIYDDFTTTISTSWLKNDGPAVSGGKLVLRAAHTDAITTQAASDGVPLVSAIELVASVANPISDPTVQTEGTFYYWWGYQHTGDFSASDPWSVWIARGKGQVHGEQKSPVGCELGCDGPYVAQTTAARYYAIERDPAATRFYLDGSLSYTAAVANGADYSVMIRNYQATSDVTVDWVRARARVTPDPAVTLGAEETL